MEEDISLILKEACIYHDVQFQIYIIDKQEILKKFYSCYRLVYALVSYTLTSAIRGIFMSRFYWTNTLIFLSIPHFVNMCGYVRASIDLEEHSKGNYIQEPHGELTESVMLTAVRVMHCSVLKLISMKVKGSKIICKLLKLWAV